VVEDVEMRTTRIRDDVGKITIISNGDISQVTNHSRGELLTSVEISVASDSDLDVVRRILREVGSKIVDQHSGVLGVFTCDGLAAMDGTKLTLRLVGHVEPGSQEEVQMEIRKRVREELVEAKVAIA
jgi:small conductance mechanosensitive channel